MLERKREKLSASDASERIKVKQAVITAAGRATRLLPATKQQPKSMLPLFAIGSEGQLSTTPILQKIFEELFDNGIREFYFIVGKEKRAVQDHFIADPDYITYLNEQGRSVQAVELEEFYRKVNESFLIWIDQPKPKGFGDAILHVAGLIGSDPFLVQAGDTIIISDSGVTDIIARLLKTHLEKKAQATLTLKEVRDARRFGVAEVNDNEDGTFKVTHVVEKPEHPATNLSIQALYMFDPCILEVLRDIPPGKGGELQLTDGIQRLIDLGYTVQGIKISPHDHVLDIGTPETYWDALQFTHQYFVESSTLRRHETLQ